MGDARIKHRVAELRKSFDETNFGHGIGVSRRNLRVNVGSFQSLYRASELYTAVHKNNDMLAYTKSSVDSLLARVCMCAL